MIRTMRADTARQRAFHRTLVRILVLLAIAGLLAACGSSRVYREGGGRAVVVAVVRRVRDSGYSRRRCPG